MFHYRFPRRPVPRAALVLLLAALLLAPPGTATLAAPTGPGQPVKLSGDLPANADVDALRVGPDDRYAVYFANPHAPDQRELYSVPVTGGAPVRLSPGAVSQVLGGYGALSFSPDGGRVLFLDDFPGNLFVVPITGPSSAATQLNTPFPDGSKARDGYFSHDGARVMWVRMGGSYGREGVYTVPSQGPASASVKLAETVPGGHMEATFSTDDSRIIYNASEGYPSYRSELYSVPTAGPASAAIKLNAPLVAGGYVGQFRLSADPQRVTYLASGAAPDLYELYSVSILGGPVTKLNPALASGEKVQGNYLTCGNQVVYVVRGPSAPRLYRTPAAGPASASVPAGCPAAAGVSLYPVACLPDTVVYTDMREVSGPGWPYQPRDLYSAPLVGPGGTCTRLTKELAASRDLSQGTITPSGRDVIYYEDPMNYFGLGSFHAVPLAGPADADVVLSAGNPHPWSVSELNPVGSRLLYTSVVDAGPREVYSVPVSGPAAASVKLNGPFVAGGEVEPHSIHYAASGRVVVYIADAEVKDKYELYAVNDVLGPAIFLPVLLR